MMGRFESNALGPRHSHHPLRDSCDPDGRLVGSFAAIKFAINVSFKKLRSDSFRKAFTPRTILLFQKMRGWLRAGRAKSVLGIRTQRVRSRGFSRKRGFIRR